DLLGVACLHQIVGDAVELAAAVEDLKRQEARRVDLRRRAFQRLGDDDPVPPQRGEQEFGVGVVAAGDEGETEEGREVEEDTGGGGGREGGRGGLGRAGEVVALAASGRGWARPRLTGRRYQRRAVRSVLGSHRGLSRKRPDRYCGGRKGATSAIPMPPLSDWR